VNRLVGHQQAVVEGHAGDNGHHRLGDAERHLWRVRITPFGDLFPVHPHDPAGADAGAKWSDDLSVARVGNLGRQVGLDVGGTDRPSAWAFRHDTVESNLIYAHLAQFIEPSCLTARKTRLIYIALIQSRVEDPTRRV